MAALMTGLMARGPIEDEVVEVLEAALSLDETGAVEPVGAAGRPVLVLAGSGKKGIKTLNVSTPAALVATAAGAAVVKMGSCATSSVLGSRELAEHLGIPESGPGDEVSASVRRRGLAFVPIEDAIPGLDRIYGGRFHVLNPLSFGLAAMASPVRADVVVFGLAHPRVDLAARVLGRLGITDAIVVASGDAAGNFVDELGLGCVSLSCALRDGQVGEVVTRDSRSLPGLGAACDRPPRPPASAAEAVRGALNVLRGEGSARHMQLVSVNAALLLVAAGVANDLCEGHERALSTIQEGRALAMLEGLREEAACRRLA